jgi:hypothetical protein
MLTCSADRTLAASPDPGVLNRLAALAAMTMPELQVMWRELHGSEPPRFNRKHIESRLAYRIQELAYGGLKSETRARLAALASDLDASAVSGSSRKGRSVDHRPVAGTRLIREWQGVEEVVTVLDDGFEWQGRPYASLSSVARAITGTRWNGPLFFGLRAASRGRA